MEEKAWVADRVARLRGAEVTAVEPLTGGAWSRAWGVDTSQERLVMRIAPIPDDFRCDAHAVRFGGDQLPVPEVLGLDEGELGWWCLTRRAEGGFLDDLDAAGLLATMDSLFGALDALRTADLSGTHGYGGWDAHGNGTLASFADFIDAVDADNPRLVGWREAMAAVDGLPDLFAEGVGEIRRLLAAGVVPEQRQVVHQDLINRNVRCSQGRLTGVFDWGCGLYGDHLYDVAWFDFWKPWYPAWAEVDIAGELLRRFASVGADLTHAEERLRLYRLHIGVGSLVYSAWSSSPHLSDNIAAARCELHGRPFTLNQP